jgi:hypothetical protein
VPAAEPAPSMSSLSRMVFSVEMILWAAMVLLAGLCGCVSGSRL